MKNYVVNLEIAKKLKENGFLQEGYYYWIIPMYKDGTPYLQDRDFIRPIEVRKKLGYETSTIYLAPTSDEILEELPKRISNHQYLCIIKDDQTYWCGYEGKTLKDELAASAKKLSNALAKMWLYLKKEGYIKR